MFFSLMHNKEDKKEGIYFYAVETSRKLLKIDFIRFGLVGASGFLVNLSALFVLHDIWGAPLWISQLTGAEAALLSNFAFHHFWTFRDRAGKKRKRILLVQFHLSFWSGALINSAIVIGLHVLFDTHYFLGLVAGSATAMFWNFFWTKFYIWRHSPHPESDLPTKS